MKVVDIIKIILFSQLILTSIGVNAIEQKAAKPINKYSTLTEKQIENSLRAHVAFLADDLLKGRDTGSHGYEIAAHYVANQFAQYGLVPAGDNNTWFQSVPLLKSTLDKFSVQMVLHDKFSKHATKFNYPEQFVMLASADHTKEKVTAKIIFVGYGIVSKKLKHNDYAGLEVAGKIVLILAGRPVAYQSEQGAYLTMIDEKIRHAAEYGAVGVIIMDTPMTEKQHFYQHIAKFTNAPRLQWQQKEEADFGSYSTIHAISIVTTKTAKTIFTSAGLSVNKIFNDIEQGKLPAGFDLNIEMSLTHKTAQKHITSPNVIGLIEGSDPTLKKEYIVYSAHLDHLGVNHSNGNDVINNGALDNATGVAIMLETARHFSLTEKPKRSILFIAVTGEEKNLLGSDYFAHYPSVPLNAIVANINIDMPILLYPFADIIAFGAQHSSINSVVESAAMVNGLTVSPDPVPELTLFVRTDHFSFVKQGIPSIYLMPGFTSTDPTINGGQIAQQFYRKHYHHPSDDIRLPIDYHAGVMFTKVNFTIGRDIANNNIRPHWNKHDFFGDTFTPTLNDK